MPQEADSTGLFCLRSHIFSNTYEISNLKSHGEVNLLGALYMQGLGDTYLTHTVPFNQYTNPMERPPL